MKPSARKLALIAALFHLGCLSAYCLREDYFHKQSDQFYYLSIADSLRKHGKMLVLTENPASPPITATSGAALVMLPFSHLSARQVFIIVSLLYFLLNISSVFPWFALLRGLGLSDKTASRLVLLHFLSFPITLYKTWPVNEGPSLALCAWLLLALLQPLGWGKLILASALAPLFRAHAFLYELVAAFYGGIERNRTMIQRALTGLAISILVMVIYRWAFPYDQVKFPRAPFLETLKYTLISVWGVFIPETATLKVFKLHATPASVLGGGCILLLSAAACYLCRRKGHHPKALRMSALFVVAGLFSLWVSPMPLARFFTLSQIWLLLPWVLYLETFRKSWVSPAFIGYGMVNLGLLAAFFVTGTTDPLANQVDDLKMLASKGKFNSQIFYDSELKVPTRQIYAFFRSPATMLKGPPPQDSLLVITTRPAVTIQQLATCRDLQSTNGRFLTLISADCRR